MLEAEEEERKKREQREQEKITNNSDSDLSDSEGDGLCAKLRPYIPKGHPRTEADIDDDDGDVVKPKIRKRLIHDDSDDERVFGGKDSEDEDSDEDNEAQKEIEGREKNERELQLEEEQRAIQKRREERDQEKRRKIAEKLAKAAVTKPKAEAEPDDINAPPVLPGGLPLPLDNVGDPNLPNISVSCKSTVGTFRPADTYIKCHCARCVHMVNDFGKDAPSLWEANRWEHHCGMGHAKKWRISIKILPEGAIRRIEQNESGTKPSVLIWMNIHKSPSCLEPAGHSRKGRQNTSISNATRACHRCRKRKPSIRLDNLL